MPFADQGNRRLAAEQAMRQGFRSASILALIGLLDLRPLVGGRKACARQHAAKCTVFWDSLEVGAIHCARMNGQHIAASSYEPHLGGAIMLLRRRAKLRQAVLAERSRITKSMLSSYERGKKLPSLTSLLKILDGLGASLSQLEAALHSLLGVEDAKPAPSESPALVPGIVVSGGQLYLHLGALPLREDGTVLDQALHREF
jgi:transcriptional regulator with XRE-family HTH domain